MLRQLEDELDLEEEAIELKPLLTRGVPTVRPLVPQKQPQQAVACPRPSRQTVSGFPRHSNTISSLPGAEQEKIRASALLIRGSFQAGCQPILNVGLVGHADRDLQRGPDFEKRISVERAFSVRRALEGFIANPAIVARITWQVTGVGASALIVPSPKTEQERARNRRVEIFPGPIPLDGLINAVLVDGSGASISFAVQAPAGVGEFNFALYRDQPPSPAPLLPRTEWMKRGAMLGLAQRAFTNGHRVKLIVANDLVQSIEIFRT
jgi:hypothetical protein